MFILIPLMLILASVVGVSVIIFRKMPYLNKLTPEIHLPVMSVNARPLNMLGNFLTDLVPEFHEGIGYLKLKEHGHLWLIELEKFLRRLRVVSLKMDRMAETWINKIRKGHASRMSTSFIKDGKKVVETPIVKVQLVPQITLEDMKREEQRLIIEIAKNPKDSRLYEILGDLYVKMNNISDAKESFEAAIELNPNSETLQKKLSQVSEKLVQ